MKFLGEGIDGGDQEEMSGVDMIKTHFLKVNSIIILTVSLLETEYNNSLHDH